MGSSTGSAGVAATGALTGSRAFCEARQAKVPAPMEMAAKGRMGMPGTRAITPEAAETMPIDTGFMPSCFIRALSAAPSTPALETRKPAAMEMIRAGNWLTKPSPMVMMV